MDFNVQLKMEALAKEKEDKGYKLVSLGSVDFPFEGATLPSSMEPAERAAIISPLLAVPTLAEVVTVNITATVIESNDLGDTISKGAEMAKKKEGDLKARIEELLGSGE